MFFSIPMFFYLLLIRFFLSGVLSVQDSANDDFEYWSPSEERAERCLFGRQVCCILRYFLII